MRDQLEVGPAPLFDPASPLRPTGNLRRRSAVSRLLEGGATAASAAAVAILVLVTWEVIHHGASSLGPGFLIHNPPQFGGPGGGIFSAIVGTVMIIVVASLIAVPLGVLSAIYLSEFAGDGSGAARALRLMLGLMQGLPTIVVGLFIFGLIVNGRGETGIAGSLALSIIMLPLISRASEEALRTVPAALREGAEALGVHSWRTILGVILPTAWPAILTATILSVARAAGETAPLLLTDGIFNNGVELNIFGHGVPNIPVLIFTNIELAEPAAVARAWGAALVLLAVILIANVGARVLLARSRRRTGT